MAKRGPKSANQDELLFWEQEWERFFRGLREGLPGGYWDIPDVRHPPKIPTHPVLLEELRRTPISQRPFRPIRILRHRIPGILPEEKLWEALLKASTVRAVRRICKKSRYWQNPMRRRKTVPDSGFFMARLMDLCKHGEQFIAAKQNSHFPQSARPLSDGKRVRFLARTMAAATMGLRPRRGIDRLREKRNGNSVAPAKTGAENPPEPFVTG